MRYFIVFYLTNYTLDGEAKSRTVLVESETFPTHKQVFEICINECSASTVRLRLMGVSGISEVTKEEFDSWNS